MEIIRALFRYASVQSGMTITDYTSDAPVSALALRYVSYACEQRVAYITLNRPEKRNALNDEVVAELKAVFAHAEDDESCKVIVLKTTGPVFCAGADISYLQQLQENSFHANLEDSTHLMQLFYQIYTLKKVVIAQVQGHAVAGGCGLATVCDFAFAATEAKFGYTEVKIGFLPAIANVFLLRKIGEAHAKELLLTGDLVSAERAKNMGMINGVVSAEELEQKVSSFAHRLCLENSAQSMECTKEMIAHVQELPLEDALKYAAERNALARNSEDYLRGVNAFVEKDSLMW